MAKEVIYDEDGKGITFAFYSDDIENTDPIKFYSEQEINKTITIEKQLLFLKNPIIASKLDDDYFIKRAV